MEPESDPRQFVVRKEMKVSNNLNPETVMEALREVKVPGTRVDVVSVNLIGEIKVTGGEVVVSVVRTSEKDETIAAVREGVMQAVSRLPGVLSVQVPVDDRSLPPKRPAHRALTASRPIPSPIARSFRAWRRSWRWRAPRVAWGNHRWR